MTDDALDPNDRWLFARPRTPEELAKRRLEVVRAMEPGGPGWRAATVHGYFTCDQCATAPVCTLAFDLYNTDGDCLLDK